MKDLTGKIFGTIKVLGLDEAKSNSKKKIWFCEYYRNKGVGNGR